MIRTIITSVFIFLVYLVLLICLEYIIFTTVPLGLLESEINFYWLNNLVYLILLLLVFLSCRHFGDFKLKSPQLIPIKSIAPIFIAVLLFRIMEDPINRFSEILYNKPMPQVDGIVGTIMFLPLILKLTILAPLVEEIVFRKIILTVFERSKWSILIRILISSILFGLIHTPTSAVISSFLFGLIASVIYLRYGLLYAFIFHSMTNIMWILIKIFEKEYWEFLKMLDFGINYWLIVLFSTLFILCFFYNNYMMIKNPMAQEEKID